MGSFKGRRRILKNPSYQAKTNTSKCVTTKLPLWLLTMDLACAKLALPVMTLPEPSFLPLLEDQDIKVSWLVWAKRIPMSAMRLSPREVSSPYPIEHGIITNWD